VTYDEIKKRAIAEWEALENSPLPRIYIGTATCGRAAGAIAVLEAIKRELARQKIQAIVMEVGCLGFCYDEPMVEIIKPGRPRIFYSNVKPETAVQIINDYLVKDNPRPDLALGTIGESAIEGIPRLDDLPMLKPQVRISLRNCGLIDPTNINHYIARGGYGGLVKALQMKPEEVIAEVKKAGLRGRGGAGFSTGLKWELCRKSPGTQKYVICNADEGDPGAFMDRSQLESDPHTMLEGIVIGGYAIGASEGYIYCRAEYPLAIERLKQAIVQMEEYGFIGDNIMGSGFSFHLHIKEGAGAFVCGEETALMASIEGKRGMPRPRPPFPAVAGLWGKPTNINNVETWGLASVIMLKGADWFASLGTETNKGTKMFSLVGKVERTGLIEVPFGIKLKDIIFGIGGGILGGKRFKAAQTGGPAGGCLTADHLDLPVEYESLTKAGSMMGSGGMVVMDEDTCMVDVARYFLAFTQSESCGKCVPCRVGTKQMLDMLLDITHGRGKMEDIDFLLKFGEQIRAGSLCGLGQNAANPVLTTIRYFREEYEEHIKYHHCRAAVCQGLVSAPCSHICPAGIDVPRYVRLIAQGQPGEATAVIREKIPFPAVCGLVCFHPCEAKCRRAQLEEAIAIRMLKGYAARHDTGVWKSRVKAKPATGKKVAIVGSGPAGLTAAYYLARQGHAVTVFEELPEAGGMMRVGIPDYRLPKDILKNEIKDITDAGVVIRTNTRIDSLEKLFKQGYNALFLAVGAHGGIKMGIAGEDSPGVMDCVTFLRDVSLARPVKIGEKVAVIGGGNAAIDSARTALRLGAKDVTIIYRRTRAEMPASEDEIAAAEAEGIKLETLAAPARIAVRNGKPELTCIRMKLGDIDSSGRPRPEPIPGSEFTAGYSAVIAAIGQRPEIPAKLNVALEKGNTIIADRDTLATSVPGVYAGGDAKTGPASVVEAIAAGRQAAISIDKFLGGDGDIAETLALPESELPHMEAAGEKYRPKMPMVPVGQRTGNFVQTEMGYSDAAAIEEAKRCLRCDLEKKEE
jgi:NADH-quinone oxidoreductase subunit F